MEAGFDIEFIGTKELTRNISKKLSSIIRLSVLLLIVTILTVITTLYITIRQEKETQLQNQNASLKETLESSIGLYKKILMQTGEIIAEKKLYSNPLEIKRLVITQYLILKELERDKSQATTIKWVNNYPNIYEIDVLGIKQIARKVRMPKKEIVEINLVQENKHKTYQTLLEVCFYTCDKLKELALGKVCSVTSLDNLLTLKEKRSQSNITIVDENKKILFSYPPQETIGSEFMSKAEYISGTSFIIKSSISEVDFYVFFIKKLKIPLIVVFIIISLVYFIVIISFYFIKEAKQNIDYYLQALFHSRKSSEKLTSALVKRLKAHISITEYQLGYSDLDGDVMELKKQNQERQIIDIILQIDQCYEKAHKLAVNLVNIPDLIFEIKNLFAEILVRNKIQFVVTNATKLKKIKDDSVILEYLIASIINHSLYNLPVGGKLNISIDSIILNCQEGICIKIRDNGVGKSICQSSNNSYYLSLLTISEVAKIKDFNFFYENRLYEGNEFSLFIPYKKNEKKKINQINDGTNVIRLFK